MLIQTVVDGCSPEHFPFAHLPRLAAYLRRRARVFCSFIRALGSLALASLCSALLCSRLCFSRASLSSLLLSCLAFPPFQARHPSSLFYNSFFHIALLYWNKLVAPKLTSLSNNLSDFDKLLDSLLSLTPAARSRLNKMCAPYSYQYQYGMSEKTCTYL